MLCPCTFRTLPEDVVEITGSRTQAQRDAELRKHALDVDADDTPAKRAKTSTDTKLVDLPNFGGLFQGLPPRDTLSPQANQ